MISSPYLLLAALALWIATGLGAFFYGQHVRGNADAVAMQKAVIEAQQEAMARQKAQDQITTDAAVKEAQAQQLVEHVYETVEQKVPVYLTKADRSCKLSNGYLRLWNAGVTGKAAALSPTASQSDASPSGATAVDALNNAIANFERANENAEQLQSLENWIIEQEKVQ